MGTAAGRVIAGSSCHDVGAMLRRTPVAQRFAIAVLLVLSGSCTGSSDLAGSGTTELGGVTGGEASETGATGTTTAAESSTGDAVLEPFSFFVTSLRLMQELSGNPLGFGGDLRFGETGAGAGLRGADAICTAIAERSMPGSATKQWRAFLSIAADESGQPVHAIDRIGQGPWYDRLGRVLANTKAELLHDRPQAADPAIRDDLPNEDGIPNSTPDPTQPEQDNHHTITGSDTQGRLFDDMSTCLDWTSALGDPSTEGRPRMGLTFPRMGGPVTPESTNWISALPETGCAPGVNLLPSPPPGPEDVDIGNGGGYGAIYCFALSP